MSYIKKIEMQAGQLAIRLHADLDDCFNFLYGAGEEQDTVRFIKKYLRTPEHRTTLANLDISIEAILNGTWEGPHEAVINSILNDWNTTLGFEEFT